MQALCRLGQPGDPKVNPPVDSSLICQTTSKTMECVAKLGDLENFEQQLRAFLLQRRRVAISPHHLKNAYALAGEHHERAKLAKPVTPKII